MNIIAQSLSHRGEIAELFIRDAATLLLHTLFAIWLQSVRSRYDLATTNALPRRLCYLGNIGASVMLPLRSWRPGQLQALFKCPPKVGVALLDSRTTLGGSILV